MHLTRLADVEARIFCVEFEMAAPLQLLLIEHFAFFGRYISLTQVGRPGDWPICLVECLYFWVFDLRCDMDAFGPQTDQVIFCAIATVPYSIWLVREAKAARCQII